MIFCDGAAIFDDEQFLFDIRAILCEIRAMQGGGGLDLVGGRGAFQRPIAEAIRKLGAVMDFYAADERHP